MLDIKIQELKADSQSEKSVVPVHIQINGFIKFLQISKISGH